VPDKVSGRVEREALPKQSSFDELAASAEAKAAEQAMHIAHTAEIARQQQHLSYAAVARKMGVSRAQVNRIMLGYEMATLRTIFKLADALGFTIEIRAKYPRRKESRSRG
jgi:DNA-binding phage protein